MYLWVASKSGHVAPATCPIISSARPTVLRILPLQWSWVQVVVCSQEGVSLSTFSQVEAADTPRIRRSGQLVVIPLVKLDWQTPRDPSCLVIPSSDVNCSRNNASRLFAIRPCHQSHKCEVYYREDDIRGRRTPRADHSSRALQDATRPNLSLISKRLHWPSNNCYFKHQRTQR